MALVPLVPQSPYNILVVVGTRPEAIKLVPIILALRDSDSYQPVVVSTGQHHQMVADVFALAGITVDVELWVAGTGGRLNEIVAAVLRRFEGYCTASYGTRPATIATAEDLADGTYPAAVLVHGDTSSAMGAALAAFHLRIPVVHVEAGLRTGGRISNRSRRSSTARSSPESPASTWPPR